MISKNEILNALDTLKIKSKWHSFAQLPSERQFATYFIDNTEFGGSDVCAEYKKYSMRVSFYYKTIMQEKDFLLEERFEQLVRAAGDFTKSCGYISENDLFFSEYTFNLFEFLKEDK